MSQTKRPTKSPARDSRGGSGPSPKAPPKARTDKLSARSKPSVKAPVKSSAVTRPFPSWLPWVAILLYPCLKKVEVVDLDAVASWGLKGESVADGIPELNGVYLFNGLNPTLLFDFSHCYDWDNETRTITCPVDSPATVFVQDEMEEGTDYAATAPSLPGPGWAALNTLNCLHYRVKLHLDEELQSATISTEMFGTYLFSYLFSYVISEKITYRPGSMFSDSTWVRDNFLPADNTTVHSTYTLQPVYTEKGGIHSRGMAAAKKKLGTSQAIRVADNSFEPTSEQWYVIAAIAVLTAKCHLSWAWALKWE